MFSLCNILYQSIKWQEVGLLPKFCCRLLFYFKGKSCSFRGVAVSDYCSFLKMGTPSLLPELIKFSEERQKSILTVQQPLRALNLPLSPKSAIPNWCRWHSIILFSEEIRLGPFYGFLVFWLQITIEPFALFHHNGLIIHVCVSLWCLTDWQRTPMRTEHIPSKHTTWLQRRCNVDVVTTSLQRRCNDVLCLLGICNLQLHPDGAVSQEWNWFKPLSPTHPRSQIHTPPTPVVLLLGIPRRFLCCSSSLCIVGFNCGVCFCHYLFLISHSFGVITKTCLYTFDPLKPISV